MAKRDCVELRFEGALTVATADEAHAELIAAIVKGVDISVDCRDAEAVDLSFVQLIIAAREAARANGVFLTLVSPASGALLKTLQRAGFLAEDARESAESRFWMKEDV